MQIEIYKTNEITHDIWSQIVDGYMSSFENHFITRENLIDGYVSNSFGYSYHAICFDGDKVVGFNSIIPYWYYNGNEKIKLGLSGTTFVLKEYRKDIFIFQDMYFALRKYCVNESLVTFLGVPNKNSYQYSLKLLKCRDILRLSYYVLPVNVFNIIGKKKLFVLNFFSIAYCYALIFFNLLITAFFNSKETIKKYRLDIDETFLERRFSHPKYKTVTKEGQRFTYLMADEEGVKTAYIMDFRNNKFRKSGKSLLWAVCYILRHEKVDIIMYVGTMNTKQALMMKVPHRFDPKILPLTYNILDITNPERFKSMKIKDNWDFSLINLDVR